VWVESTSEFGLPVRFLASEVVLVIAHSNGHCGVFLRDWVGVGTVLSESADLVNLKIDHALARPQARAH
jgi:hypothetical protein